MRIREKLNSRLTWIISAFLLMAVLYQVFWSLNKGMLFSDEAYYLFRLMPGLEVIGTTYWHIIYSPFIFENFITTKYLLVFLTGSSAYLMGNTVAKYLRIHISPILIGIWCIILQFALLSPVGFTPNYSNINPIIFNGIILFLSLFFLRGKKIFLMAVGFFFASLTFVMITNNIFLVPLLMLLYIHNKSEFWKNLLWYCAGALVLLGVYFAFLQSPQEFISGILKATNVMAHDKTHGVLGLKIWHYKLLKDLAIPIMIYLVAWSGLFKYRIVKYALLIISAVYLMYLLYSGITHKFSIFHTLGFYFVVGWILLFYWKDQKKFDERILFSIILLILPYFASFGTDVDFFIRSSVYFPPILLGVLYIGFQINSKKGDWLSGIFLAISIVAILTFFSYPFRPTWEGYKLIEQDRPFTKNGITIYLDEERYENLMELYPYLKGEENVIVSYQRLWGYVYNSGAKPPYLHYKFSEYTINYIEENNISKESILLLEDKHRPFEREMIQKLVDNKFILKKVELLDFNIYTLEDSDNL